MKEENILPVGFCTIPRKRLIKAEWNYKTNDDELLEKLVNNMRRNGVIENLIVRSADDRFLEVVNGNHRLDAGDLLNLDEYMCYNLGKISLQSAQRIAIETNETKFQPDNIKLAQLIKNISDEFNMDDLITTLPFEQQELNDLVSLLNVDWENIDKLGEGEDGNDDEEIGNYSRKIKAPIYEPKNEKPLITDVFDEKKTLDLIQEIKNSKIELAEKDFLIKAAQRHRVFNYSKIADYYAHSNKEMQELMEKSALVIIDFNKAIEYGFVKLTQEIADLYGEEYGTPE